VIHTHLKSRDGNFVEKPPLVATPTWAHDQGKGLQGCRPKWKLGSVGKCEGMNPHTPKGASTLGVGIPVDS